MAADGRMSREYQDYIFRRAIHENVIACLPTGSGKTYIACLLMKHFAAETQEPFSGSGKRIFFLVPQKVLVRQQANEIRKTTPFSEDVDEITGDNDADCWTAEQWKEHLNRFRIFVMIHDIFKNLLAMGDTVLPVEKISLLVFDEAHHASLKRGGKITNHPYRQILDQLRDKQGTAAARIRLLGLTASVINNRTAVDQLQMFIQDLETAFLDAECVVVDSSEVHSYKTNAEVRVWLFSHWPAADSPGVTLICTQLCSIRESLQKQHNAFQKEKMFFHVDCEDAGKVVDRLHKCLTEGSMWIARELCRAYRKELKEHYDCYAASFLSYGKLLDVLMDVINKIESQLSSCLLGLSLEQQVVGISSPKLLRLLEILENYSSSRKEFRGIVFVETRLEAKALCNWIREATGLLSTLRFVRVGYLTGYSSRPGFVDKLSRLSREHQHKTMLEFIDGDLNLLVATSVLEEGLDVPECNCVIRFHLPNTYRSYQQSMGRARAKNAAFYLMCKVGKEHEELTQDLQDFETLGKAITNHCKRDKELRDQACGNEMSDEMSPDEEQRMMQYLKKQKVVHPETKAEISADTAVSRVHEYLAQVSSGWTPRPEETYEPIQSRFVCKVRLPLSSSIRDPVLGHPMSSQYFAKKSAYLEICRELMKRNLLDEHLKPIQKHVFVERIIRQLDLQIPREETAGETAVPGTKGRKQTYAIAKVNPGRDLSGDVFVYRLVFKDHDSQAMRVTQQLAVVSFHKLPSQVLTSLVLYKTNREVVISMGLQHKTPLLASTLTSIQWFHKFVFCQMLDFGSRVEVAFDADTYLVAPLDPISHEIDLVYIRDLQWREEQRAAIDFDESGYGIRRAQKFCFRDKDYDDAVVRRWYRTPENEKGPPIQFLKSWAQSWKVAGIEKSLGDVIPNTKKIFAEYYDEKYNLKAGDSSQRLLKVVPPAKLAVLTPNERTKEKEADHFVPEFCEVCPMSASMWEKVTCLPAFFHRLNQLQLAFQFRRFLTSPAVGLDIDAAETYDSLCFFDAPVSRRATSADWESTGASDEMSDEMSDLNSERPLDEDESDDSEECKKIFFGSEGDMPRLPLTPRQVVCNAVRRGLANRTRFRVFQPHEKFVADTFVSAIHAVSATPSFDSGIVSNLLKSCQVAMRNLDAILKTPGNGGTEDCTVPMQHHKPKRCLEDDVSAFQVVKSFDRHSHISRSFSPGLHIEVFSAKSAHDMANSERLETLGDSFLKFAVTSYLHARASDRTLDGEVSSDCLSEGHLTTIKGQLVSNYNLYRLSKNFRCGEQMFVKQLDPKGNWLPPGFAELPGQEKSRTTQTISDKAVADSVEALIGAIVLKRGDLEAIRFLSWMGLPVAPDSHQLPRDQHWLPDIDPVSRAWQLENGESERSLDMRNLYDRSNLSRLEMILNYNFKNKWFIINAITHSSCYDNWVTGSYEKLEFLGDAILDRCIATFCFECKRSDGSRFDPGQMTDLRSALVNNAYLGCLLVKFDMHNHISMFAHEVKYRIDSFAENFRSYDDDQHLTVGAYVMLKPAGGSEDAHIRHVEVPKILGDVLEALIGAIYLDSGRSLDAVWRVVYGLMKTELIAFVDNIPMNPIRRIYEDDPNRKFFGDKQTDANTYEVKLKFKGREFTGVGRNHKFARLHAAMKALF